MIIERSGALKLSVEIASPFESTNIFSEHGDRWSELRLIDFTTDEFHLFQKLTPSSKLTSLRTLSLYGPLIQEDTDIYEFDSDWLPPFLETLSCTVTVPKRLPPSSLTTCMFEFAYDVDLRGIAVVLSSTPFLETLSITIGEAWELEMDEDTLINLPSLQNFSFYSYSAEYHVVEKILQAIHFPNITTLCVDIHTVNMDDLASINACFWREIRVIKDSFTRLKKLDLGIALMRPANEDYFTYSMNEFFKGLPQTLESFSLSVSEVELRAEDNISLNNLGQLRSLKFHRCNRLVSSFFENLASWFKDENMLLDVLDIQQCWIEGKSYVPEKAVKTLFRNAGVLQS